jgi:integrase
MKYLNLEDPDELLKHKVSPVVIQEQVIEYMIHLKNPPCSLRYATRSQYLAAVITFYELNEVILNKKKIYRYLGEEERPIENRGYTSEEIAKMLEFCDERVRAIILFLASSGIRIRAIIELKLEDLASITEYELYQVRVYASTKDRYFTFITPEASKALNTYLSYRKTCGEKLRPGSPLFRDQFNRNDQESVFNPKPIELRGVEWLISQAIQKSGLSTIERQTELYDDHGRIRNNVRLTAGFRKFFDTQLIYARVEPRTKEIFMGHSIGLDDHYYRPEDSFVLHEYLKALDYLTINEENRLRKKVKELTQKQSEIEIMKENYEKAMREMNNKFRQIMLLIQQNPGSAHIKPDVLSKKIKEY